MSNDDRSTRKGGNPEAGDEGVEDLKAKPVGEQESEEVKGGKAAVSDFTIMKKSESSSPSLG